ncbi:testis-specific serine/threonine-protein kinase 3-like [Lingula anatina]|uniref:Testis-specific serine/threonine-protein kinase 3-like n=1 Tax=Lingula anatina TaxID=7574 RepID=A0A1S3ILG0_LINAN|nr:testis-specific serine/threonine-protein kinase 3-like [Lingula anatina]XP_013398923.1 testis-specific serine/threonine-protein kinase 3-like [Lingula anatina]|eukprot:XP_013389816.1 testis-specific serine/threonine-protein kinase 3-like [Lingula anatina]
MRIVCGIGDAWCDTTEQQHKPCPVYLGPELDGAASDLATQGYTVLRELPHDGNFGCGALVGRHESDLKRVAIRLIQRGGNKSSDATAHSSGEIYKPSGSFKSCFLADNIELLQSLRHENLIKMHEFFVTRGHLAVVAEYCENGDLAHLVAHRKAGFLIEPVSRRYFKQIFQAMEYLHHNNIAHRDVKCSKFVVSRNNVLKLCDLGTAVLYKDGDPLLTDTKCGSPGYRAPELLSNFPYDPRRVDMWAMGVLLYYMATGLIPYHGQPNIPVKLSFPNGDVLNLSRELKQLLQGLLTHNSELRFTLNRVRNSPWLCKADDGVYIGNFFRVRQPEKVRTSAKETKLKRELHI